MSQLENESRMLMVGPAWVGDMVMAQTLFILLKQQCPMRKLDVIAPGWTLPLIERMPEINKAIPLPIGHGKFLWRQRLAIGKELRKENYAEAIILPNSFKSALIPFWAKIPKRIGWNREFRSWLLTDTRNLDKAAYPLMIQRFAALAFPDRTILPENLPKPKFEVKVTQVAKALHNNQLVESSQSILALCPGAEFGSSKRWPERHYATIANKKLSEGWQVWLFGSPKDREVSEKINQLTENRCVDLTGKTQLSEAIDLLSLVNMVVTNDSGLMHVAAALDRPLVAVYGSTSSQFTPPLTSKAKILATDINCRPCFQRECPLKHHLCMVELSPERVLAAMDELLQEHTCYKIPITQQQSAIFSYSEN